VSKPAPQRIPSDDCALEIGGETFHPHEGEWVELLPVRLVGDAKLLVKIIAVAGDLEALQGDSAGITARMAEHFDEGVAFVRPRLVAWNWTDLRGVPLAQPREDPGVLHQLAAEELWYLVAVIQGRNPAATAEPVHVVTSAPAENRAARRRREATDAATA
jgi:hypothetical protein